MSDSLQPHGLQYARLPCPSPTPGACSNSCPWSRWYHPTISSSVIPLSSSLQSFPASGSFPMSQFFTWGGQSTGVSASASVLPMNTQDWSPSERTGWISLQSKGLSRVFSNTTVQKHQFFSAQLSSQSTLVLLFGLYTNNISFKTFGKKYLILSVEDRPESDSHGFSPSTLFPSVHSQYDPLLLRVDKTCDLLLIFDYSKDTEMLLLLLLSCFSHVQHFATP